MVESVHIDWVAGSSSVQTIKARWKAGYLFSGIRLGVFGFACYTVNGFRKNIAVEVSDEANRIIRHTGAIRGLGIRISGILVTRADTRHDIAL